MGVDRRAVIGLIAGGAVGTMFTPAIWKTTGSIALWSQNWGWIPRIPKGERKYAYTTSKLCPSGSGLKVLTVDGLPLTAAGNPAHPLSQGGVSALGLSECYLLYSPARVKKPLLKTGAQFKEISWDEALGLLADKLKAAGGKAAAISGDQNGTANEVISALLAKLGCADKFFLMPSEGQAAGRAWQLMGGHGLIGYDLANADTVLALGADLFESSGATMLNARSYSAQRSSLDKPAAKLVYVGSQRTTTAYASSKWVPCLPGREAAVALGLAALLIKGGASSDAPDFADFKAFVSAGYTPDKVEALTGIKAEVLEKLAKKLTEAKKPLVVAGSEFGQGAPGAAYMAALAVNILLKRINVPGGVYATPEFPKVVDGALSRTQMASADLVKYLSSVAAGKTPAPELLITYDANPAFGLPQAPAMAKALAGAGFKAAFASFMDETAAQADLVLPASLPMERYDDVVSPYGAPFAVYSLVKPLLKKPVHDTKAACDVILAAAAKAGLALGADSFEKLLKTKVAAVAKSGGFIAGKDASPSAALAGKDVAAFSGDPWKALMEGAAYVVASPVKQDGLTLGTKTLAAALKADGAKAEDGALALTCAYKTRSGSPAVGIPAQDLTAVRDTELAGTKTVATLNAATAKMFKLEAGESIKLTGPAGEISALVALSETVMTGVVAVPMGFGHTAFDDFSKNKGQNVLAVMTATEEPATGVNSWSGSKVKIAKI
ncbi:MAG: molybdopterin-dependent oxidoreductase [Desulfovibrionaceae bacterium]|nr:molybdopterin-dependent oxidoreductase [Desulfovibrionaceae bacterium]MBF0514126.1 molybdopterin-dependent oxidoreductase [Desulfovibrionaceae bacterium]